MTISRAVRYGLLGLAGLLVLLVAAAAVFIARFNPDSLKPRIEAAVEQATGRTLALNGPIHLTWSLRPTVAVTDVALANPPGFSRPQMATLQRLDVRLAVLPLLRGQVEIASVVLQHPDILLEQNAQGQGNWVFTPTAPRQAPPTAAPSRPAAPGGSKVSVGAVRIEAGTVAFRDDRTGQVLTLTVTRLTATAASPAAPLHLAMTAAYGGVPFTLNGEVGPLADLQQPHPAAPWPVNLRLAAAGASVSVNGSLTQPLQGRGYKLALDATVPNLATLAPLAPNMRLPPLTDMHLAARIDDSGGKVPHVDSASIQLGPADLSGYVAGLHLVSVDIEAPPQNQPVHIDAKATMGATPLSMVATVGAPATLLAQQPTAPVPVDADLRAADATLAVHGTVAHPGTLSGANLALTASIPNLAALEPVLHRNLPALTRVAFEGQLTDASGGFSQGAALHGIKLTAAQGDLAGDIAFAKGPPPSLTATLQANRIDADALLAAAGKPVAPPPGQPAAPPGKPAPAAPPAKPPPAAARRPVSGRLFSDAPLPFGLLRQVDANVTLHVADLHSGGADYRQIALHAVLQGGKLQLNPLAAMLPEGALNGSLSIDGSTPTPPIALTLQAPGLEVAPLFAAAGLPGYASGRLQVDANLHSAGASPHAIAAGLDGTLGLAMQNGTIDTRLLNDLLGPVLERANLLALLEHGGSNELRCFALRANAQNGVANVTTLLLNSPLLTMDGSGSVNLGSESLALALRPQGRIGGTGFVVPLEVTGPIRQPAVKANAIGAAGAGLLNSLLGGGKLLGGPPVPSCAAALAAARGQAAPAAASHPAAIAHPPAPPNPGALLKQLFR